MPLCRAVQAGQDLRKIYSADRRLCDTLALAGAAPRADAMAVPPGVAYGAYL